MIPSTSNSLGEGQSWVMPVFCYATYTKLCPRLFVKESPPFSYFSPAWCPWLTNSHGSHTPFPTQTCGWILVGWVTGYWWMLSWQGQNSDSLSPIPLTVHLASPYKQVTHPFYLGYKGLVEATDDWNLLDAKLVYGRNLFAKVTRTIQLCDAHFLYAP